MFARTRRSRASGFEVFAHASALALTKESDVSPCEVRYYSNDPDSGDEPLGPGRPLRGFKGRVTVAPGYWRQLEGNFAVRPGQVNEWTLPLPEELLNVVLEELKGNEEKPRPNATPEE